MRVEPALLLAVAVSGCLRVGQMKPPMDMEPPIDMARATGEWGVKLVDAKYEPSTLIARDGTRCTVTPDRFRAARVGDGVACYWVRDG